MNCFWKKTNFWTKILKPLGKFLIVLKKSSFENVLQICWNFFEIYFGWKIIWNFCKIFLIKWFWKTKFETFCNCFWNFLGKIFERFLKVFSRNIFWRKFFEQFLKIFGKIFLKKHFWNFFGIVSEPFLNVFFEIFWKKV